MSAGSKPALSWSSILVAIPVGVVASLVTLAFREMIDLCDVLLFAGQQDITVAMHVWPWFCWPVIVGVGGLLAGFFLRQATALEQKEPRKTDYLEVINARLDSVPTKTSLFRSLSSLASIASGASIGREGPMVQLAALSGSLLGRGLFRSLSLKNSDIVAMAAAAGLSSVYHAPLASAIFVAEIAFGIAAMQRLIPLLVAAAVAVLTMWLLGYRSALYPFADVHFELTASSLALTLLSGLLAGLLGWGIIWAIGQSKRQFSRIQNLPLRLGLGGVLVGFLAIGSTQILGNGYDVIVRVMAGDFLLPMLAGLLLLKLLATLISVGSGAVGGLFTPALLMGALMGQLLAALAVQMGLPINNVTLFAAVGMGAVLAAVSQAPLMAILMVLEMTLNSSVLFPVMLACVLSSMVAYRLRSGGTYPMIKQHFRRSEAKFALDNGMLSHLVVSCETLTPTESVGKALAMSSLKRHRFVYVTAPNGVFLGAVSIHDIAQKVLHQEMALTSPVGELVDADFPVLFASQTIREGWDSFADVSQERLPTLNNPQQRRFIGVVTKSHLLQQAKALLW